MSKDSSNQVIDIGDAKSVHCLEVYSHYEYNEDGYDKNDQEAILGNGSIL